MWRRGELEQGDQVARAGNTTLALMKRYEERLLEDMQSPQWLLLSTYPLIFSLPNELLILIFECTDSLASIKAARWYVNLRHCGD